MVCNNAQTGEHHFERDCAYTLIGIPFGVEDINTMGKFVFEFVWGKGKMIKVKLLPGTVLYYSGFGIMHRQISLEDGAQTKHDFKLWNIATYGNKIFYANVMSSLTRIINASKN